ncbi:MAG: 3-phosphoshikimate 1-carboxyvinyltransferase [Halanaerobiales bacterium]|nr:3-phosphoshikimate 1-carboxyvinyltransferase [Halanaerobiales bacterium]
MNKTIEIKKKDSILGTYNPPPDKSISHRSIIFAAIGRGSSKIHNLLEADDCLKTVNAFKQIGIKINKVNRHYEVKGKGLFGLKPTNGVIDCGNSGTTLRLLSGLLSGQKNKYILDGDSSLQKRPMKRIISPLTMMGANIKSLRSNKRCPVLIKPAKLNSITYRMPIASAQVKSALLLANMYTDSTVKIIEKKPSRDHTEKIMKKLGFDIKIDNKIIKYKSNSSFLIPSSIYNIPGDFSQAAYFITLALLTEGSKLYIKNVNLNPTRTGFLQVVKEMGANIETVEIDKKGEPTGDLLVSYSKLHGIKINEKLIPLMIDEIPLIAVLAIKAKGITEIKSAQELRYKESDRLQVLKDNFNKLGLKIDIYSDGFKVKGPQKVKKSNILDSNNDHRMAMTFSILASLFKNKKIYISNYKSVNISYPQFFNVLKEI